MIKYGKCTATDDCTLIRDLKCEGFCKKKESGRDSFHASGKGKGNNQGKGKQKGKKYKKRKKGKTGRNGKGKAPDSLRFQSQDTPRRPPGRSETPRRQTHQGIGASRNHQPDHLLVWKPGRNKYVFFTTIGGIPRPPKIAALRATPDVNILFPPMFVRMEASVFINIRQTVA